MRDTIGDFLLGIFVGALSVIWVVLLTSSIEEAKTIEPEVQIVPVTRPVFVPVGVPISFVYPDEEIGAWRADLPREMYCLPLEDK